MSGIIQGNSPVNAQATPWSGYIPAGVKPTDTYPTDTSINSPFASRLVRLSGGAFLPESSQYNGMTYEEIAKAKFNADMAALGYSNQQAYTPPVYNFQFASPYSNGLLSSPANSAGSNAFGRPTFDLGQGKFTKIVNGKKQFSRPTGEE